MQTDIKKLTEEELEFLSNFDTQGLKNIQKRFLYFLYKKIGNISQACKASNISREGYYEWYRSSDIFKKCCDSVRESLYDDIESEMYKKIFLNKDTTMMIWMSKCKMADRGYVDRLNTENKTQITSVAKMTDEELDEQIKKLS